MNRLSLALAASLATISCAQAQTHYDTGGSIIPGVSAGQVKEVCVTPTVTASNAYGTNYVQGGLLTFPLLAPPSGGFAIQSVYVDANAVEIMGWTFTPFSAQPSATTWTDAAAAAISDDDDGREREHDPGSRPRAGLLDAPPHQRPRSNPARYFDGPGDAHGVQAYHAD